LTVAGTVTITGTAPQGAAIGGLVGYSEGTILSIHGGRAITEFPIGKTFQGRVNDFAPEDEMAIKNVALDKLIPIKEELFNE
jgi:hypothetical protein